MKFSSSLSKKNEMATYKRLGLSREHKSKRGREKASREKLYCYIGKNAPDRPFLKVLRSEYLRIWDEENVKSASQKAPKGVSEDQWADLRRHQVETAVYFRLARQHQTLSALETSFQKRHGRGMTPHEKKLFAKMLEKEPLSVVSSQKRIQSARKSVVDGVVRKIEGKRRHQPARLQQAWATVVGEEAAQETFLEKMDVQNGVALCRCLSSTLAFKLRRHKTLAAKLGKELGMNIRKIIFR